MANLASRQERHELMKAIKSGKFDDLLKGQIEEVIEHNPIADISDPTADEIFKAVITSPSPKETRNKNRKTVLYRVAASVALFVTVGFAAYFLLSRSSPDAAIVPGSDKAILTLADGTKVELDSVTRGNLFNQGGVQVVNNGGNISYSDGGDDTHEVMYNTISTPRGGQYEVILADGTHVWLNASSSLRYPVTFDKEKRKVEMTGEAYFEVAQVKNEEGKVPFTVEVSDMKVNVLGTHFNIMAYEDEPAIQTTLLEGSVLVEGADAQLLLEPGQQSNMEDTHLYLSASVDTRAVIAWKDGYFRYADTDITYIMNQLGRWYDVNIEYDSEEARSLSFGGVVSRRDQVTAMLDLMELTGAIHFEIEGRTILVKQGEKK